MQVYAQTFGKKKISDIHRDQPTKSGIRHAIVTRDIQRSYSTPIDHFISGAAYLMISANISSGRNVSE